MRIVAGELGGRTVRAPKSSKTRPMSDKVRAALFDILGSIENYSVLDAYAGSGAVGFEAISRGAERVTAVECDTKAISTIKSNIQSLGVEFVYQLVPQKIESWLARKPIENFDLIVVDPPYDAIDAEILEKLASLMGEDAFLILKYPRGYIAPEFSTMYLASSRDYGDQKLAFYRKRT